MRKNLPITPATDAAVRAVQTSTMETAWSRIQSAIPLATLLEKNLLLIPLWYQLDRNHVPPVYGLQNITTMYSPVSLWFLTFLFRLSTTMSDRTLGKSDDMVDVVPNQSFLHYSFTYFYLINCFLTPFSDYRIT
jgi:hypothetical protein